MLPALVPGDQSRGCSGTPEQTAWHAQNTVPGREPTAANPLMDALDCAENKSKECRVCEGWDVWPHIDGWREREREEGRMS
jgi:hypothetical protein